MKIGIIGPGRLGRSFASLLRSFGHQIDIAGRERVPRGDLLLLTVPDAAIASVARLVPPGPILLHCSGAAEVDVLRPHPVVGSLHPLMTFPGPEIAIPELVGVPCAVAGDPVARQRAEELARDLGMVPFQVLGDRRLYHAAAVMAGNFATVLLAEAATVLARAGVVNPAAVLAPLALQSIKNSSHDPIHALTGPAVRGDTEIIEGHLLALRESGLLQQLNVYALLASRATELAENTAETRAKNDRGDE